MIHFFKKNKRADSFSFNGVFESRKRGNILDTQNSLIRLKMMVFSQLQIRCCAAALRAK